MKRVVGAALLALVLVACSSAEAGTKKVSKKAQQPVVAETYEYGPAQALAAYSFQRWIEVEQENARIAEEQRQKEAAETAARIAAEEAARQKAQTVVPQVSSSGPHSDAWWQGVAICEQSGNNHPFFGYFSIMDGSAGGLPWSTQVAMANQIIMRAGERAWAASCVAMGYAHSPGG